MKVYVRKGDYQSPIPGLIVTILFLAFSIFIFYFSFTAQNTGEFSLLDFSIPLTFAIVFFIFSLYFVHALFKKPKGYQAKLIKKYPNQYKGREITLMVFKAEVRDDKKMSVQNKYICYTYENNDLVENRDYIIKIKEFNWKIKTVEELHGYETENSVKKLPHVSMVPVVWSIFIIFASIGLWSLFNIIRQPSTTIVYIFPLFFSIVANARNTTFVRSLNFYRNR